MEITIERLGHLGDGLAAGPIFVDRALPGEVVSGDLVGDRWRMFGLLSPPNTVLLPAAARSSGAAVAHCTTCIQIL